jgi:hypothetical protein
VPSSAPPIGPGTAGSKLNGIDDFRFFPVSGMPSNTVPARFDTDHMAVTIENFRLHRWQQIPIVELRA